MGGRWDYISQLSNERCVVKQSTSRILHCDNTWKALLQPVKKLQLVLDKKLPVSRYYIQVSVEHKDAIKCDVNYMQVM